MALIQDAASVARRLRGAVAASAVCGAVALAVWFAGRAEKVEPLSTPRPAPMIEAENVRSIVVREGGRKVWEFAARRIEIDANQTYATAQNVTRGVLYGNGAPLWKLTARNVRLNQQTRDVDAGGGVHAQGPNGLNIATRRARWTHRATRLNCPEAVTATLPRLTIQTGAASYEAKTDALRCTQTVTVSSEFAELTSPRAVAHPKAQTVSFEGGVDILIHTRKIPQLEEVRRRLAR